jgi:uncharacterized surface protein with fasciclin (FAS1) repeats
MKGFHRIVSIASAFFIWGSTFAADMNVVQITADNKDFSTFVSLLKTAHLVSMLEGQGPFTLFAPTNEAFSAIPQNILDTLIAHPEQLKQVLLYHVVGSVLNADKIKTGGVQTLEGHPINFILNGNVITVNGAEIIQADIQASNGIIHVINKVLIPPAP